MSFLDVHPRPCPYVEVFAVFAGPLLFFGTPCWKPFLNFRGTSFNDRMRPVPVVFLRLAFMPQLSVNGFLLVYRKGVCIDEYNGSGENGIGRGFERTAMRTLSDLSSGITA